ncbi:hypothetical protein [Pectobacterium polaris]|uniref:hypothetical protein n=1 Tax=Pectobacterium polaris TaxID=2042057 RepID=UPI001583FA5B|nr:hypothetical protein [Pectobacterium polaris]
MIDAILPVILSICSLTAAFTGAFISIKSIQSRRKIERQLSKKIRDIQIKKNKIKYRKDLENSLIEIESELKRRVELLNKMQMDLEGVSSQKLAFDKAKYLRNSMYEKYLLEVSEVIKNIDNKNKHLLNNALNQGSELGKVRYLEKITKEALEKN